MALRELIAYLGYGLDHAGARAAHAQVEGLKHAALELASTFGLVLGGAEVVKGFGEMIGLASEAQQATQRLEATFGPASSAVSQGLGDVGRESGLSRLELLKLANTFGPFLTGATSSAQAAGDMAVGLARATADMQAFFDIPAADAAEALRAGLHGAERGLLRFGVDARDAALQHYALSKGIQTATKDMSKAQVTALRYELILKELGRVGAAGDAADGMKEFEGATRALKGALQDLATSGGGFFLETATKVVLVLRDLAMQAQAALKPGEDLWRVFNALAVIFDTLVEHGRAVFGALAAVIAIMFPGLAIVAALAALVLLLTDDLWTMGEGGESVTGTLIQGFKDMADAGESAWAIIGDALKTALDFWAQKLGIVTEGTSAWQTALDALAATWEKIVRLVNTLQSIGAGAAALANPLTLGAALSSAGNTAGAAIGSAIISHGDTHVSVDASGSSDPQGVAKATAGAVREALDADLRNARAALVEGG